MRCVGGRSRSQGLGGFWLEAQKARYSVVHRSLTVGAEPLETLHATAFETGTGLE